MIKMKSALLIFPLLMGCSESGTKKNMTVTIKGKAFAVDLIRTDSARKQFLSWNTLSGESAFAVRHTPPRHHFYDSHGNDFDILFLDTKGAILEIAHLEAKHEGAVTSQTEAEWAIFLLPDSANKHGMEKGDQIHLSKELQEEKTALLETISINRIPLRAEVARTSHERQHGLMHRTNFSAQDAMIFLHEKDSPEEYWMQNVHIDLDIAFFRADHTLINVVEMKTYPDPKIDSGERARPKESARYVVETNFGWFRKNNLSDQDGNPNGTVRLTLPPKLR